MTAATLFDGGKTGSRRGPFAGLFGSAGSSTDSTVQRQATQVEPPAPDDGGGFGLQAYLRGLEQMIDRTERSHLTETLVEVTPREVQSLIEKSAKAKARYLALALDLADGEGLPEAKQIEALETARSRHEAMQNGLNVLLAELRRGQVRVAGVAPEPEPQRGAGG